MLLRTAVVSVRTLDAVVDENDRDEQAAVVSRRAAPVAYPLCRECARPVYGDGLCKAHRDEAWYRGERLSDMGTRRRRHYAEPSDSAGRGRRTGQWGRSA